MTTPTLQVEHLHTVFDSASGPVPVVTDVSFNLARGKVLGIVGESGSGKSMLAYSLLGLLDPPAKIASGAIRLQGQDLQQSDEKAWRTVRGKHIAMIFQDAMQALNPLLQIGTHMLETLQAHQTISRVAAWERACQALLAVGIAAPEQRLHAYPQQFSGGMRQRVAIALALLNNPEIVLADEPTTALDVSLQRQILNLMKQRCQDFGTSVLWISHDLAVVAEIADEVAVMYAGKIIEQGSVANVLTDPQHPYTHGLIAAIPARHPPGSRLPTMSGTVPAFNALPVGCAFQARCPWAQAQCQIAPPLQPVRTADTHLVRCWYPLKPLEKPHV